MASRFTRGAPAVAVAVALATAGCRAPIDDVGGADGGLDVACTPFADLVIEYKPAGGDNDVDAGAAALGAPDDAAVAIATDTVLTVGFVGLGAVIEGDGPDLGVAVVGTPAEGTLVSAYTSVDGDLYEYAGDLTADATTIDLGAAGTFTAEYLRLVGLSGVLAVDAVEAIAATCPAARSAAPRASAHAAANLH